VKNCTKCVGDLTGRKKFCGYCGTPIASENLQASEELICRARCSDTKRPFLVWFKREREGIWFSQKASEITERQASSDAFTSAAVIGKFWKGPAYSGCPYCGKRLLRKCFKCNSGWVCVRYGDPIFVCPWCGNNQPLGWGPPSGRPIGTGGSPG
jgi:hypothetical protein